MLALNQDNQVSCATEDIEIAGKEIEIAQKETKSAEQVVVPEKVEVARWVPKPRFVTKHNIANRATRHFALHSPTWNYIMSEKKQERDFTPEVDAILPEAESLAKVQLSPF